MIVLSSLAVLVVAVLVLAKLMQAYGYLNSSEYYMKQLQGSSFSKKQLLRIAKNKKLMSDEKLAVQIFFHPSSNVETIYESLKYITFRRLGERGLRERPKLLEVLIYSEKMKETRMGEFVWDSLIAGLYPTHEITDYIMRQSLDVRLAFVLTNNNLTEYAEKAILSDGTFALLNSLLLRESYEENACSDATILELLTSQDPNIRLGAYKAMSNRGLWREAYKLYSGEACDSAMPLEWVKRLAETARSEYESAQTRTK